MVTLGLKNIGCIHKAEVKVGGLTVLTGYNDIGKSTIGKVMFMLVKTAWEAEEWFKQGISEHIDTESRMLSFLDKSYFSDVITPPEWIPKINATKNRLSELKKMIAQPEKYAYRMRVGEYIVNLFHNELYKKNSDTNGILQLAIDHETPKLEIDPDNICHFEGNLNPLKDLFTDVTFIDSPLILVLYKLFRDKRFDADRSQLVPTSILEFPIYRDIVKKIITPLAQPFGAEFDPGRLAIRELFLKLSARIQGNIKEYRSDELLYRKTNTDGSHSDFPMVNVASGIKSLGLLGLLMENGYVQPRHLLVIDEPESHLHPQWEVLYGKLLVQLAMENVPIIVSTHSGTLLEAIMRASEKLDAEYLVNYYVGDKTEKGTVFTDVTETKWEAFEKISRANEDMMFNEIEQW